MKLPKINSFVTSLLALLLCVMLVPSAFADAAGNVTHLSGPLLARKADGSTRILSQKSAVESGDLLVTEKNTYARVKFTDNSEITLKPNTQIKIDAFLFDKEKPEADSAIFNLIKGGLRALTGLVGKRGNQDSYQLKAPAATIGIRGTDFLADLTPQGNLFVEVLQGAVEVRTTTGVLPLAQGQIGLAQNAFTIPVIVPARPPEVPRFQPPPSFNAPIPQPGQAAPPPSSSSGESRRVDCEVR
jgi:hypothetical protein